MGPTENKNMLICGEQIRLTDKERSLFQKVTRSRSLPRTRTEYRTMLLRAHEAWERDSHLGAEAKLMSHLTKGMSERL